jgi:hypothetical protein
MTFRRHGDTIRPPTTTGLHHLVVDFPSWMTEASCSSTDPEEFFPDKGGSTRLAKRICGLCPVSTQCLAYALENRERFGIWGGVSERDRRRLTDPTPRLEGPKQASPKQHGQAAIRTWARNNGHHVNRIGSLPNSIRDAYFAAHEEAAS